MKKDKNLEHCVRGFYLYDKGENDELFHEISYSQLIYKYILTCMREKVKNILKNFFYRQKIYFTSKKCSKLTNSHFFHIILHNVHARTTDAR